MSVRKEFRLDEKDVERFEIIKDRHGFRNRRTGFKIST